MVHSHKQVYLLVFFFKEVHIFIFLFCFLTFCGKKNLLCLTHTVKRVNIFGTTINVRQIGYSYPFLYFLDIEDQKKKTEVASTVIHPFSGSPKKIQRFFF